MRCPLHFLRFFFFNDTATTEIYTLSLHDALPIWNAGFHVPVPLQHGSANRPISRSEEHTSELQSLTNLVCRLLLEKKKDKLIYLECGWSASVKKTILVRSGCRP